jgi:hypothetical protein
MFERLDEFYKSYRANLISLKEIAEPLNLILTKYKYYANLNNLRVSPLDHALDQSGMREHPVTLNSYPENQELPLRQQVPGVSR